jgi:hypothetical protein
MPTMKPFEVYVDTGSAAPVKFTLDDAKLRGAGSKVRYALEDDQDDPDERTRLWRGALVVARALLAANDKRPIEVYDGPDVWIIPAHAVRWVHVHDPESPDRRGAEIGFRMGGEEQV